MFRIIKNSDVTNGQVQLTDHFSGEYELHSPVYNTRGFEAAFMPPRK